VLGWFRFPFYTAHGVVVNVERSRKQFLVEQNAISAMSAVLVGLVRELQPCSLRML